MELSDLKNSPNPKVGERRAPGRFGRPPKELAGEVEERLLDAARKVFLARGFEGASMDEIAEAARSGKQTIYARFRDKRALFTAVVTRDILSRISQFKILPPSGTTIEERLVSAAMAALHWSLDDERMALMRLAVAEAGRFPDLASTVSRAARELSTEVGARLLGEIAQSSELASLPAFAPERLQATARVFLDLVAVPMIMRALFEVDLKNLEPELGPHVTRCVEFFLAGCRRAD
jgi:AcrR family transcriptional regulator